MGVALRRRTDLYLRVDLYLHTSEKMIGGAYLFSLVFTPFSFLLFLPFSIFLFLSYLSLPFFYPPSSPSLSQGGRVKSRLAVRVRLEGSAKNEADIRAMVRPLPSLAGTPGRGSYAGRWSFSSEISSFAWPRLNESAVILER